MSVREKIFNQLKINNINPKAHISKYAKLGKGNLIEAFAKLSAGSKLVIIV